MLIKPVAAMSVVAAPHAFGWLALPLWVGVATIAASLLWMGFVGWYAWSAFRRLDRKRLALLEASGVACDFAKAMASPRAWRA